LADTAYARGIVVNPRARSLSVPKPSGLPYGRSFLREPEISAVEATHLAYLAARERKAGVR